MFKQLVALLLAILLLLAGVYSFRAQLLGAALHWLLRQADVSVQLLEQLDASWNGVTIGRLELASGPERTPQILEQIRLDYTLFAASPIELSIARAHLQLPSGQENGPPLSFSESLAGLMALPLDSIAITELEIAGLDQPLLQQPMAARLRREDEGLELWLKQPQLTLALAIAQLEPDSFHAELELAHLQGSIGALDLSLATGEQVNIEGTGRVDVQRLLRFLAPMDLQPQAITSVRGQLSLDLSAVLPDLLVSPLTPAGTVYFHEGSKVELATTAGGAETTLAMEFASGLALTVYPGPDQQSRILARAARTSFNLQEHTYPLQAEGLLQDFECDLPGLEPCQADVRAKLEAPELIVDDSSNTRLLQVNGNLDTHIELREQGLTIEVSPGELLRAASVQREETSVSDVAVSAERPVLLHYNLDDGQATLQAERLAILLPRVNIPDLNIATRALIEELALTLAPSNKLSGRSRVSAPGINLQSPSGWLPALALRADLEFDEKTLDVRAGLGSAKQGELFSMNALYRFDAGQLTGRLRSNNIEFNANDQRLSGYFANWPYDWDILDGYIALSTDFVWPGNAQTPTLGARIRTNWQGISGNYANIGFTGLNASAAADYAFPDKLVTPDNATVTLEKLDVGVPIEDINASFRVNTRRQQLHVPSLEARLFGGRLWTDNALLQANRTSNRVDLGVDGLQLERLLTHTGYEAIQATGSLSGLLPLDINASGVTMQRGMLAARAPGGVFNYRAALATNNNAALAQVGEVLSNYHYTIFQVEANYLHNGDLELAMQLRGRNPDMDNARPIHLNLNVTDNIPMLLKSLQSGRNITDIIGRRVGGG